GTARSVARGQSSSCVLLPPSCNWRLSAPAFTSRARISWRGGKAGKGPKRTPTRQTAAGACWVSWGGGRGGSRARADGSSSSPRLKPSLAAADICRLEPIENQSDCRPGNVRRSRAALSEADRDPQRASPGFVLTAPIAPPTGRSCGRREQDL